MTVTLSAGAAPALSRPVPVDAIPEGGLPFAFEATAAECAALARLNGLVAVERLAADLLVRREGREGFLVTGMVSGQVVQTCVVSLESFPAAVGEQVEVHYLQPAALERWRAEHPRNAETEEDAVDEPDAVQHNRIDLGALAAEHLTLGLDPYPRKPGVRFEEVTPDAAEDKVSPFAALKALRPDGA